MTTQEKLIDMLADKGYSVDVMMPALGYWRRTSCDVHRWDADCKDVNGKHVSIGSWYTMTECVRKGFNLVENPRDGSWYLDVEIAESPKKISRSQVRILYGPLRFAVGAGRKCPSFIMARLG